MIEIRIFLILAVLLFINLFIENIKIRNKKQILFLILDVFSILLFVIYFLITRKHSHIIRVVFYSVSIITPTILTILNKYKYDFREGIIVFVANILVFFDNNQLARKIIYDFLEKRPHSFSLHKKLGDMYKEEGGIRKALKEYIIAINLKHVPSLYLEITEMLYDLGNKDEAKEALTFILNKEPDFFDAQMFLSKIYLDAEQYKEAAKTLEDALKCPDCLIDYEIHYNLGEIYAKLNDFQASKTNFEKAYELKENHILQFYIAQIYLIEKEDEKALEKFRELLYYETLKPYVLYELAKYSKHINENSKAISYVNEAIKLEDKLKDKAFNEELFLDIKSEFVVSVKLDEDEIEALKEELSDDKVDKKTRKNIFKNLNEQKILNTNVLENFKVFEKEEEITENETQIIDHLSNIFSTITHMGEVTSKLRTKERVDRIFEEKLKKEKEKKLAEILEENEIDENQVQDILEEEQKDEDVEIDEHKEKEIKDELKENEDIFEYNEIETTVEESILENIDEQIDEYKLENIDEQTDEYKSENVYTDENIEEAEELKEIENEIKENNENGVE